MCLLQFAWDEILDNSQWLELGAVNNRTIVLKSLKIAPLADLHENLFRDTNVIVKKVINNFYQ